MKTLSPHDWREKHPRCSFCQWLKLEMVKVNVVPDYYTCIVKDKIINFTNIPRPWCRCYTTKITDFIKEGKF